MRMKTRHIRSEKQTVEYRPLENVDSRYVRSGGI